MTKYGTVYASEYFDFYRHCILELTSCDVCVNPPADLAQCRNCSSSVAGPRRWRPGSHGTGGRAHNYPEWLQSESIRDKARIALQIGSSARSPCDQTVDQTGNRCSCSFLFRWPIPETPSLVVPHTPWANTLNAWIALHYMLCSTRGEKSWTMWQACFCVRAEW